VVVLPGTRATLADLAWLRDRGLAEAVLAHASRGGVVLGICGGFQMLGRSLEDPDGVEGPAGAQDSGLGLLDVHTRFGPDKVLRLSRGEALGAEATGYEIHHGRVVVGQASPFVGGARSGAVFGTMWHGSLEGDALRRAWLVEVAGLRGRDGFNVGTTSFAAVREKRLEDLADAVEAHLDMAEVLRLLQDGAPPGLPTIRGGLS
jgi:adenosylcobyric acid synthase